MHFVIGKEWKFSARSGNWTAFASVKARSLEEAVTIVAKADGHSPRWIGDKHRFQDSRFPDLYWTVNKAR